MIRPRLSWLFAAAIVATWIGGLAIGVDPRAPSAPDLVTLGGNYGPRTFDGQWWRLVTAASVHAGWLHLAINAALLLGLGTVLEARLGAIATGAVLLGATVAASAASLATDPYAVSVGASGAVAGVCGALVVTLVRARDKVTTRAWIATAIAVALAIGWGVVLAITTDGVDHAAHLAGLAGGAAIALPGRRPLGALAVFAAVIAAAIVAIALARPPVDVHARAREVVAIDARYQHILDGVGERADGPRLARTLEAEVLGPLRVAAARQVVDDRLPARDRQLAISLAAYTVARLRALDLYTRELASGDDSLDPAIDAAQADARAAADALR